MPKFTVHGLPGVYNATPITLSDGQGTALAVDVSGRIILSDSVPLTIGGDVGELDQLDLTNSNPAVVAIVDGNGDQIISFGGGTQYTHDDVDGTPTGTGVMFRDVSDDQIKFVSSDDPLPVLASIDTTGLATSAKQDTIIGHVDGIEGLLTTIDADTGNMDTSLNAIEASVASIDTDTTTIIGHLDGVETLIGTTNTTLTTIDGRVDGIEGLLTSIEGDTSAIQTAIQIMDDWDNGASDGASISGDVAHDTADVGEPVKIGGKALNLGSTPTPVSSNDRTNAYFTRAGQLFVIAGHPNIISKNFNVTDADGAQTNTDILGAIGTDVAVVVTKVSVMVDAATTNVGGVAVRIGFGASAVPSADAAGIILAHPGISAGSGIVEGSGAGIIGIGGNGEELRVTCEDPTGGNIDIIVTYFTIDI